VEHHAVTDGNGTATITDVALGDTTVLVQAVGFESLSVTFALEGLARERLDFRLNAEGAWAVGRAVVLGTRVIELSSEGSSLTFSADVAVIDEDSQALETLTSADFSITFLDCGLGGTRDCASDAAGNETSAFDGDLDDFIGLQPPSDRHPYAVDVLVERSDAVTDWDEKAPALKRFFTTLGGNDVASLTSVQTENGSTAVTALGSFTNDGSSYLDAIDKLSRPAGNPPELLEGLNDSIRRAAAAEGFGNSDVVRSVLVLARSELNVSEIAAAAALAQQMGVRVNTVGPINYGLPEIAMRTGGFVAEIVDRRQFAIIFGAMDRLLSATVPYYRLQFSLRGREGTFVSGGNVKVRLRIDVPHAMPNRNIVTLDVALP